MALQLYNTRTRRLEAFTPQRPPQVMMYVCGPTVYDEPHIGHARSAYVFDVIRRWLVYRGYQVHFVRNVTDVDDKIIERAKQELGAGGRGQGAGNLRAQCAEGGERYLARYHEALAALGIESLSAKDEPRATQYIDAMTDLIGKLLVDGIAYEAAGSVYFSVKHFAGYGRLSNRTPEEMQAGTRVEPGEGKRDPLDFALWKAAKSGEPSWPAPWGAGRPGWHVECSAMSAVCLGSPTIDISGGGLDLLFPHHENEIAQSEAASKQSPFAHYWLHHGLLTINGQKMSKSLGNFVTVEQAVQQWGADTLKMFFLSAHYRSSLNYTEAGMAASKQRYENYRLLTDQARSLKHLSPEIEQFTTPIAKADELKQEFLNALDDDFNTPQALSVLDEMRSLGWQLYGEIEVPGSDLSEADKKRTGKFLYVAKMLEEHGTLLRLSEWRKETGLSKQIALTLHETIRVTDSVDVALATTEQIAHINEQIGARDVARRQGNYARADEIRQELLRRGVILEDTKGKTIWRLKR